MAFSPDGMLIAAGCEDSVRVWRVATGEEVLILSGHVQQVTALAFRPDGRRIITSSLDGTVKVWHTQTGEELLTLQGHRTGLWCVALSHDGRTIAAATSINEVRLWKTTSPPKAHESSRLTRGP